MNEKLTEQKIQLKTALAYAEGIEVCDTFIADNIQPEYYRAVRVEAMQGYANAMAKIIEGSIKLEAEFHAKIFKDEIFQTLDAITNDYRKANGITL